MLAMKASKRAHVNAAFSNLFRVAASAAKSRRNATQATSKKPAGAAPRQVLKLLRS